MKDKREKVTIIGGVNLDIGARPEKPLIGADSNPGKVSVSPGGVGRNIAYNLRLLGQEVSLITVFGDDDNGRYLRKNLTDIGIDVSASEVIPGADTSTYLFITDERGEMQLAVADMDVCNFMTPAFLEARMEKINASSLCVMDTNLPEESVEYLAEHLRVPLFVDPVSTAKMKKLKKVLGRIHTLKPNRLEAELLSGITISDESSLRDAASALLEKGMKRVFISLGAEGVFCAEKEEAVLIPGIPAQVRNTTGSGDCFTAALAYAWLKGYSLGDTARLALSAGAICAEGEATVNESLSEEKLLLRAGLD